VAVEPQPLANGKTGSSGHASAVLQGTRELAAGQRLETNAAVAVADISPTVLSNSLAWSHGAIVFDGEPLVRAVAELNRYSDTRLVVADPSIDDLRVGGRFRTGDVEGFLKALTRAFPVTTHRTSDHLVYIARRPRASASRSH
jgi:transmembrane sensor